MKTVESQRFGFTRFGGSDCRIWMEHLQQEKKPRERFIQFNNQTKGRYNNNIMLRKELAEFRLLKASTFSRLEFTIRPNDF